VAKVALVTGGAKRIGRAISLRLGRAGYAVAIHGRGPSEEAEALRVELTANGGLAAIVTGDLADPAAVDRLIPQAREALGPVKLLVNNASVFLPDDVRRLDLATWERHFAVNLRAPTFLAAVFAAQVPPEAEGAVVNILDQRVWRPTPQFFSYTLTKAALHTATKTMAQALAPRIRVNAVGPGPTLMSTRQTPEDFARQVAALPLGTGPTPDDIAEAVLMLANARTVTGQMIAPDSGQHLAWETPDVVGVSE
jgi:NAD(P)-dependent dehydrogenase (short-subunit alcohol dehydrogenase family)